MKYLDYFLIDNPNEFCSKGGHAAYGDAVSICRNSTDYGCQQKTEADDDYITASYSMAYHRVCIKSYECQENLESARYLGTRLIQLDVRIMFYPLLHDIEPCDTDYAFESKKYNRIHKQSIRQYDGQ